MTSLKKPIPQLSLDGNPFAACRISPGAIPYLFPPERDTARLIETLRRHGWWGQITGPHGSGKTTLIESLAPALERAGRTVCRFTLRGGERRLPAAVDGPESWNEHAQVVVDGYEQLAWWPRRRLRRACRRSGAGLLVTAHSDVGLPDLFRTAVSLDCAQQIVRRLLPEGTAPISEEDVARLHALHGDDLRETLFALYDLFEQRRP